MDNLQTSPRENIQDIKQSIMESPDTCANSCFYLAFKGKRVNDYFELGEIEGITPESELELIEGIKYITRENIESSYTCIYVLSFRYLH